MKTYLERVPLILRELFSDSELEVYMHLLSLKIDKYRPTLQITSTPNHKNGFVALSRFIDTNSIAYKIIINQICAILEVPNLNDINSKDMLPKHVVSFLKRMNDKEVLKEIIKNALREAARTDYYYKYEKDFI